MSTSDSWGADDEGAGGGMANLTAAAANAAANATDDAGYQNLVGIVATSVILGLMTMTTIVGELTIEENTSGIAGNKILVFFPRILSAEFHSPIAFYSIGFVPREQLVKSYTIACHFQGTCS